MDGGRQRDRRWIVDGPVIGRRRQKSNNPSKSICGRPQEIGAVPVPLKRARVVLLSGTIQSIDLLSADSAWCYQGDGPSTAQTPRPGWRFGHRAPRRLRPRKHQGLYEGFSRCRLGRGHTGDTQGEEGAAGGGMCGRWARAGAFATANTRSQENRGPPMTHR